MNKINIVEMLNLRNGNVSFDRAGFVISKHNISAETVRDSVIECLGELDIFDEDQTKYYANVAATSNYFTDAELEIVVKLIVDFGSKDIEFLDKTVWFN